MALAIQNTHTEYQSLRRSTTTSKCDGVWYVTVERDSIERDAAYEVSCQFNTPYMAYSYFVNNVEYRVYRMTDAAFKAYHKLRRAMVKKAYTVAYGLDDMVNCATCAYCNTFVGSNATEPHDGICRGCWIDENRDKVEQCEECEGTGEVYVGTFGIDAYSGTPNERYATCYTCEGTGSSGDAVEEAWQETLAF